MYLDIPYFLPVLDMYLTNFYFVNQSQKHLTVERVNILILAD